MNERLTKKPPSPKQKFVNLVDEYNANAVEAGKLEASLKRLYTENDYINNQLILLTELIGVQPEVVEDSNRFADQLRGELGMPRK